MLQAWELQCFHGIPRFAVNFQGFSKHILLYKLKHLINLKCWRWKKRNLKKKFFFIILILIFIYNLAWNCRGRWFFFLWTTWLIIILYSFLICSFLRQSSAMFVNINYSFIVIQSSKDSRVNYMQTWFDKVWICCILTIALFLYRYSELFFICCCNYSFCWYSFIWRLSYFIILGKRQVK